jgi:hypothetical protein
LDDAIIADIAFREKPHKAKMPARRLDAPHSRTREIN